jgi:hypothetical protein
MAQDAAGPSTPTEKRSVFRHFWSNRTDGGGDDKDGGLRRAYPTYLAKNFSFLAFQKR